MAANSLSELTTLSYPEILVANGKFDETSLESDFKIHILTNITINPIKELLEFAIKSLRLKPIVTFGNYDNVIQDSFSLSDHDIVIIFYEMINFGEEFALKCELMEDEELNEIIERHKTDLNLLFSNLANHSLVLLNEFSSYGFGDLIHTKTNKLSIENELNSFAREQKPKNFELIEVKRLIASMGLSSAIDHQKFRRYKAPYKIEFLKSYVSSLHNLLLRRTGRLKKALVLDCDNTLWKGILGEDGIDGIEMSPQDEIGVYYHQVQKIIVTLSKKGILVCLCSKNNLSDVEGVLQGNHNMILKEEHIVAKKVNWNNKADNLRQLADELNIGLDSFVFVDDSDFEIGLIKSELPEVATVTVPKEVKSYPSLLLEVARRNFNLDPLGEDLKKVKVYKDQVKRVQLKESMNSIDSYLATLETQITICLDDEDQTPRIAQLTQKTNQFNLTTIRYTENDILQFIKSPAMAVFSLDVADRFGESGITGVCILKESERESDTMIIDSLLLSCRILGRRIEDSFLDYLLVHCKESGFETIKSKYKETKKNSQVRNFFSDHGFEVTEENVSEIRYSLNLNDYSEKNPEFIERKIKNKIPINNG